MSRFVHLRFCKYEVVDLPRALSHTEETDFGGFSDGRHTKALAFATSHSF